MWNVLKTNVKYIHFLFIKAAFHSPLLIVLLVRWNFVGQGERQLTLDIGDTVHIEEVCDGKNTI